MKETYEKLQMEVIEFEAEDVITESDPTCSEATATKPYQIPA